MGNPLLAPLVWATAAALASSQGPYVTKWAYVQDQDGIFQFYPGDASVADGVDVLGVTGGGGGAWKRARALHKGANLTDASLSIQVSGDEWRVLPAATLSTARSLTLGTLQARAGHELTITRLDVSANVYSILNGGVGAGTLATFPVSQKAFLVARFDGTNWVPRMSALML